MRTVLGQNVYVSNDVKIGNTVKIQNNVSVYDGVTLEDGVFVGRSFTNVFNLGLFPEKRIPNYCKKALGANSTLVAGITVGDLFWVGAVITDVKPTLWQACRQSKLLDECGGRKA